MARSLTIRTFRVRHLGDRNRGDHVLPVNGRRWSVTR
jgi:hypothetical protein